MENVNINTINDTSKKRKVKFEDVNNDKTFELEVRKRLMKKKIYQSVYVKVFLVLFFICKIKIVVYPKVIVNVYLRLLNFCNFFQTNLNIIY